MTDAASHIPREIRDVLDELRRRIRKYVLIEGVSAVPAAVATIAAPNEGRTHAEPS